MIGQKRRILLAIFSVVVIIAGLTLLWGFQTGRISFKAASDESVLDIGADTADEHERLKQLEGEVDKLSVRLLTNLAKLVGQKAGEKDHATTVSLMVADATERQELLAEIIGINQSDELPPTAGAFSPSLNSATKLAFPPEAQQLFSKIPSLGLLIEKEANISGKFGEVTFDYNDGGAKIYYNITSAEGVDEQILFVSQPIIASGDEVTIRRLLVVPGAPKIVPGETAAQQAQFVTITKKAEPDPATTAYQDPTESDVLVAPARTRNVAVVLVNFRENQERPVSVQKVDDTFFYNERSVKSWFEEVSKGKLSWSGGVYGYYTLTIDRPSDCTYTSLNRIADAAIPLARADIGRNFSVHMWGFIFPANGSNCRSLAGMADSAKSRFWIPAYSWNEQTGISIGLLAHEMGHNLNLSHAGGYSCLDAQGRQVRYDERLACSWYSYFDEHDTMGAANGRHFSAVTNEKLGWLATSQVRNVTQSGTYTILPSNRSGAGIRGLRIATSSDVNSNYWVSVEYRRRSGLFDDFYGGTFETINGLLIRKVTQNKGSGRVSSAVLYAGAPGTRYLPALALDRELFLAITGLSFKTVALSESSASVEVTFNPECIKRPATVAITPVSASTGLGGNMAQQYQLSITNNNRACSASVFSSTVFVTGPSATVTATLAPASQPIGASETATAVVEASGGRASSWGRYELRIRTRDALNPGHITETVGQYWVR